VYPFSVEGERRMMSFNATVVGQGEPPTKSYK
jgi:hypothetical protein